jgi:hypothetical protein
MNEPVIVCPNCSEEIKLTESLAAPLVEATRQQYEVKLANKEFDIKNREAAIREKQLEVAKAQESVDEQVAIKLTQEREKIAAQEARKARLLLSGEMDRKDQEVLELQKALKEKDGKLADAQKAQHDKIVRAWWILEAAAEQFPHRRCLAFARQRDSGWQFGRVGS